MIKHAAKHVNTATKREIISFIKIMTLAKRRFPKKYQSYYETLRQNMPAGFGFRPALALTLFWSFIFAWWNDFRQISNWTRNPSEQNLSLCEWMDG